MTSLSDGQQVARRKLTQALLEADLKMAGVKKGDTLKITSIRGNDREVTYDGEVGMSGIKVNDGMRYYFDAISKIEKI